jgi:hypothetical protein
MMRSGVVAGGQGAEFVDEVFDEVVAAHVGEFMRDDGAEVSLGQGSDHRYGQEEELAGEADGDRAANAGGRGDGDFADGEFIKGEVLQALRPVEGGFAGEDDGRGFAA